MKIIYSNFIPHKRFAACNLFGVLFIRKRHEEFIKKYPNNPRVLKFLHHEQIHTVQMKWLLYVPFYIIYGIEWLFKIFTEIKAYRNISFEREAYKMESVTGNMKFDGTTLILGNSYAGTMKPYSWVNYVFHRK